MPGRIFLLSFLVGLVQIGLSYAAGIHLHSSSPAGHRFGYLQCYNWSVIYLTVVPAILAACIPNTIFLYRRSRNKPANRRRFWILLAAAFVYAAATAGREAWQSLYDIDRGSYFEWNSVSAGEWDAADLSGIQSIAWHALFLIAYAHYFVGGFFGFAGAFGTLWYFRLLAKSNQPRKLSPDEEGLLFNQKLSVLAYLLFLVLLRSAKVSMSLMADGKVMQGWKIFDLFKQGEAYLEAISGGLLVDILFGAFWLSVTVVSHGFAHQIQSPNKVALTPTQFLQNIFERIAHGYVLFGTGARFWAGVLLIGIVVPAPGFPLLVAAAVLFGTLQLMKRDISISKDSTD